MNHSLLPVRGSNDSFSCSPRKHHQLPSHVGVPLTPTFKMATSHSPRASFQSKHGSLTALPKQPRRALTHALQMLQRQRRRLGTAGRVMRRSRHHPHPTPSQTARAVTMTTGGGWPARASRDPSDVAVPKPPRKKMAWAE